VQSLHLFSPSFPPFSLFSREREGEEKRRKSGRLLGPFPFFFPFPSSRGRPKNEKLLLFFFSPSPLSPDRKRIGRTDPSLLSFFSSPLALSEGTHDKPFPLFSFSSHKIDKRLALPLFLLITLLGLISWVCAKCATVPLLLLCFRG